MVKNSSEKSSDEESDSHNENDQGERWVNYVTRSGHKPGLWSEWLDLATRNSVQLATIAITCMKEILHCMKYCDNRPTGGLVLELRTYHIMGRQQLNSDSDYTKEPVDCRSVSDLILKLEQNPVMCLISTYRHIVLWSVKETELYVSVSTA